MTTVTTEEIQKFRSQLAHYPDALKALNMIEECDGDLEDATEILAIEAGTEIVRGSNGDEAFLQKLANKLRPVICTKEFENAFLNGSFSVVITALSTSPIAPLIVITPVILYISHKGWKNFCKDCNL